MEMDVAPTQGVDAKAEYHEWVQAYHAQHPVTEDDPAIVVAIGPGLLHRQHAGGAHLTRAAARTAIRDFMQSHSFTRARLPLNHPFEFYQGTMAHSATLLASLFLELPWLLSVQNVPEAAYLVFITPGARGKLVFTPL